MAYPIIEQIAQAIKTRLESVTVANSYETGVVEVVRPTRVGEYVPRDAIIVLTQDNPAKGDDNQNQLHSQWTQPFYADYHCKPSDRSTVPIETTINAARSDIEKAIMTDGTFGGLALYSIIQAPVLDVFDDFATVTVVIDVVYRTLETNPYSTGA